MKIKRHIALTAALMLAAVLLSGCATMEKDVPLLVEYYYFNACASCAPEKEFQENFETITGISRVTTDVKVKTYNVFKNDGQNAWEETAKNMGIAVASNFPILNVGGELVRISDTLTAEDYTGRQASVIVFISPGEEGDGENIIARVPAQTEINGAQISTRVSIMTLESNRDKRLFKKYCEAYHVKDDMQVTPIVFVGRTALSGPGEIEKLEDYIKLGRALDTKIIAR